MSKRMMRLAAAACGLIALVTAARAADFRSWNQRMAVSFPGYTRAETLTNYPALVKLDEAIPGFRYADFLSGGYADLRFTDATLTRELIYDVERWDTNGTSLVWVRVPELAGPDTRIWAFWGKRDQTPPLSTADGAVWDDGFLGVWHLDEPDARDATPNRFHGTAGGSPLPTPAAGVIGSAVDFTADLNFVTVPDSPLFTLSSAYTVSAWIRSDPIANDYEAIIGTFTGSAGFMLLLANDANNTLNFWTGGGFISSGKAVADNAWTHVAYTREESVGRFYIDGAPVATTTARSGTDGGVLRIGAAGSGWTTQRFDGRLDEARLESVARGSNWMWACYLNTASNETFTASLGDPGATEVTDASALLNGAAASADGGAADVWVYWDTADRGASGAWQQAAFLGTLAPGLFSHPATGLAPNTWYYYTFSASNAAGVVWGPLSKAFKTLGPPVPVTAGAIEQLRDRATLTGALADGTAAEVWLEWWRAGAATTNTHPFGWMYEGALALGVTNLSPVADYAYRLCATNLFGTAASEPCAFTTPAASSFYVALSGDGSLGASWATAFTNLQAAINAALPGDTLFLKADTFVLSGPNLPTGKLYWGPEKHDLAICGGYLGIGPEPGPLAGVPTMLQNTNVAANTTNRLLYAAHVTNGVLCNLVLQGAQIGWVNPQASVGTHLQGAGVYMTGCTNMLLDGVSLLNNYVYGQQQAQIYGGGLYALNSHGVITNALVQGNWLQRHYRNASLGGGIHLAGGGWVLRDVMVRDNTTAYQGTYGDTCRGVGLYINGGAHLIANGLFTRNYGASVSAPQGEAIYVAGGTVEIENCTFYWHRYEGLRQAGGSVTLRNSIIWDCGNPVVGTVTRVTSAVQGVDAAADPQFERGLFLASSSPYHDAGDRSVADAGLTGYTVRADGTADADNVALGYHFPPGAAAVAYYVDAAGGSDADTGLAPASAFKTITRALAAAGDGSRIHAAAGLYDTANGETFPLTLANRYGLQLIGAGPDATILRAPGADNKRVVSLQFVYPDARIEGVTLRDGWIRAQNATGAGLNVLHAQGVVASCLVTNNLFPATGSWGSQKGAGIYAADSAVTISNCVVRHNRVISGWADSSLAAGIYLAQGGNVFNCIVTDNQSIPGAGSTTQNKTRAIGGGLYLGGDATIRNCLIARNEARDGYLPSVGDGVHVAAGTVAIENCTVADNLGEGVRRDGGTLTVNSAILWGNGVDATGTVAVAYSTVGAGIYTDGGGNGAADPRFVGAAEGDYRLDVKNATRSPAINAGDPVAAAWMPTGIDLDGNPRVLNRRVDQGAYENLILHGGTVLLLR